MWCTECRIKTIPPKLCSNLFGHFSFTQCNSVTAIHLHDIITFMGQLTNLFMQLFNFFKKLICVHVWIIPYV